MCANFIYDLNGKKGPNTVGKDIGFIGVVYATDSLVVSPMPLNSYASSTRTLRFNETADACRTQNEESRVPNIEELMVMFYVRETLAIRNVSESFEWRTRQRAAALARGMSCQGQLPLTQSETSRRRSSAF